MNPFWRVAHKLYGIRGGVLPRFFELISMIICGNAISAKARIGQNTVFHHRGIGCVVHDNAVIGNNCHIFQNVTIGSKWPNGICDGTSPVIGNNVMIGAGAVIIGKIKIGDNVSIGANAVVLTDIPNNSIAVGVPARIIERKEK